MDAAVEPRAAPFTTRLVTTEVGVEPSTGAVWYFTGGIAGIMVNIGTAPVPPANTVPPTIINTSGGTNAVGKNFTINSAGTWVPTGGTSKYQWYSGGVAIPGATAALYTAQSSDIGNMLTAAVTYTVAPFSTTAFSSNSIGPVTAT